MLQTASARQQSAVTLANAAEANAIVAAVEARHRRPNRPSRAAEKNKISIPDSLL